MAQDTLTNLQTRINEGKSENKPGKNTKTRVFQLMLDILDTVKGWLTKLNFDIDANGKRITGLLLPIGATEPVRKEEFDAHFSILNRFVKDYDPSYNLKGFCIANQSAPLTPALNDVYYFTGQSISTVFGVSGVSPGAFLMYSTVWNTLALPVTFKELEQFKKAIKILYSPLDMQMKGSDKYPFGVVDEDGNVALLLDSKGRLKFNDCFFNESIPFSIVDENGVAALLLTNDGKLSFNNCHYTDDYTLVIVDSDGNIGVCIDNFGKLLSNEGANAKALNYNRDINMFVDYGQSLGQGDWQDSIISNVQKYNSLMFTGGIRVWENRNQATIYDALVPAIENAFIYTEGETVVGAGARGETPCIGIADKIVELINTEDGFNFTSQQYQILVSAPGMGGTGINDLSATGGIYYLRLLRDVTNGKRLAEAAGKTFWCPAVSWIQGESDLELKTGDQYYEAMVLLFDNINRDIKAITGQTEDVHFFLYQTQAFDWFWNNTFYYPDIPLAQLRISLEKKNVHLATPIYHLPHFPGDCHFTAVGSKWFGGFFGIAYKRVIIDGNGFNPIHLIEKTIVGNDIYLKFYAPSYPLVLDVTSVTDRGVSKGFQIREANDRAQNSHLDIITNVSVNKFNTIKITCSQNPIGKKLTYAINGTSRTDTSSGNLRDSQSIKFSFKESVDATDETVHDMYNWCPIFETII